MSLSYAYQQAILRPEWAERSTEIKIRDKFTCQKCQNKSSILHVHHKYYVFGRLPWEYPDQALITLCNTCHSKEHNLTRPQEYRPGSLELLEIEEPEIYLERKKEQERIRAEQQRRMEEEEKAKAERRENLKNLGLGILFAPLLPFIIAFSAIIPVLAGLVVFGICVWLFGGGTFSMIIGAIGGGYTWYRLYERFKIFDD